MGIFGWWRWQTRAPHPRHRSSLRWWVAQSSATALLLGALAVLALLSLAFAVLVALTDSTDGSMSDRLGVARIGSLSLAVLRSLLGMAEFPAGSDNVVHQFLATVAAVIGVMLPALVIGIVIVRLFAVRIFQWRRHVSVCLAAELEGDFLAKAADPHQAYLAVRWYKRLHNVSITNLRADAYLRVKTVSKIDGSTMYRYKQLMVLGLDGSEARACTWPETFAAMPFTLWIPLGASLENGRVASVQGRRLVDDGDDRQLVVRLSGRAATPAGEVSDERRYHLVNDVQVGRFVPVEPNVATPAPRWPGWPRFEERIVHAVFVYDAMVAVGAAGRKVVDAELVGYRRCWEACPYSDSGTGWQFLELSVHRAPGSTVQGRLVRVEPDELLRLDAERSAYTRIKTTEDVRLAKGGRAATADVIWMYVATPEATARGRQARQSGTARISGAYLADLRGAVEANERLRVAVERELPPDVPVVDVRRASLVDDSDR